MIPIPNPDREVIVTHFPLGQLRVSATVADTLSGPEVLACLRRHASRDWGDADDMTPDDRLLNDLALHDGSRILSAYRVRDHHVWIITEADRSVTTIMFPDEY